MINYAVFMGAGNWMVVPAEDADKAQERALQELGFPCKTYLARDWNIRPATDEEVDLYARLVDTQPRQSMTAKAKRPSRSVRRKLV